MYKSVAFIHLNTIGLNHYEGHHESQEDNAMLKLPNWIKDRRLYLFIPFMALIITSACGGYKQFEKSDYDLGSHQGQEVPNQESRAYGFMVQGEDYNHHNNEYMAFSQDAANAVMKIPGIAHAYVVTTNVNAYVGIVLNDTATGWQSHGGRGKNTTNVGNSEGVYDVRHGGSYLSPRKLVNDSNSYYTLEKPADITPELKQKIAVAVRNEQPYVWEVFISANRDFVNQLNVLAQKKWTNQSLDGEVASFNALVKEHFRETENQ
ncbi:hypothetical protein MALU111345_06830 [Marinicrinis lubricantis]